MIFFLRALFFLVLLGMLAVTVTASLERGVFEAASDLWSDAWFRATLADAYFGFLTVYVWIAYRERGWARRLTWFVLLMALGNTPIMEWNIFNGARTLAANLAYELPEAVPDSTHYRTLFLAALVLFAMTFALNTVAEAVRQHFRKKAIQL